jgi:hypothetical protein
VDQQLKIRRRVRSRQLKRTLESLQEPKSESDEARVSEEGHKSTECTRHWDRCSVSGEERISQIWRNASNASRRSDVS